MGRGGNYKKRGREIDIKIKRKYNYGSIRDLKDKKDKYLYAIKFET